MGLLLSTIRLGNIFSQKRDIEIKLSNLRSELFDLSSYSALVGSGSITMNDIANAPTSIFSRLVNFVNYSTNNARLGAQEKFPMYALSNQYNMFSNNGLMQQQYMDSIFTSLYKQEMDKCIKVEAALLNAKETKIKQEINTLEARLSLLNDMENKNKESQQASAHV